jgi:hypothetical protein
MKQKSDTDEADDHCLFDQVALQRADRIMDQSGGNTLDLSASGVRLFVGWTEFSGNLQKRN